MYCALSPSDAHNTNANPNIIFTIKDKTLYVPIENFSARYNQKLSKHFSKVSERSFYRDAYKTKSYNKNMTNE